MKMYILNSNMKLMDVVAIHTRVTLSLWPTVHCRALGEEAQYNPDTDMCPVCPPAFGQH